MVNNSSIKSANVLIVGVGGQGVITLSDLLSKAATLSGFDVKKSEVHGMSQRGGSVNSHVRYGKKVYSPLIEPGQANIVIALEKLEALRYLPYIKPDNGVLFVNDMRIDPIPVASGQMEYPEGVIGVCKESAPETIVFDAKSIATGLGNARLQSTIMAGVAASRLEIPIEKWHDAIKMRFPEKLLEINIQAFEKGLAIK